MHLRQVLSPDQDREDSTLYRYLTIQLPPMACEEESYDGARDIAARRSNPLIHLYLHPTIHHDPHP